MHRRAGVDNNFSFLRFKIWWRSKHLIFRRWEECCFIFSFNSRMLLASLHAASRAHRSCHSVSSKNRSSKIGALGLDRSSNFGALGLRWWGSPGKIISSEGFWSRMSAWRTTALVNLVWRAIAFVNFTRWIGFGMSVHFRRIDFGGVMSWNTQPNCRESEDWRLDEFCPNFLSLLFPDFPGRSWHSSVTGPLSCQSPFFRIVTALLPSFYLDLFVGCSSTWRCANEHFSPNQQPLLVLKNKHTGGCHYSQNELVQVPLK